MSNSQIDQLINVLKSLKTTEKKKPLSKALMKKWDNCLEIKDLKKLTIAELRLLANHFGLEETGEKSRLAKALWKNWEDNCSESEVESESESEYETDSESEYETDSETD